MKMKKFAVLFFLAVSFFGLQAQNPCPFRYGANEADSIKCLEGITSFRVPYEQKDYSAAYSAWQSIISQCPCSWNGIFINAPTMFDALIKGTKDSLQREKYIDSLLWAVTVRHIYFPANFSEGSGLGLKANYTLQYKSKNNATFEKVFDWFTTSIDMEKEKTQPGIWNNFFRMAELMTKMKKDTTIIIEAYERATEYIEDAIITAYKQYERQLPNLENLDSAMKMGMITPLEYNNKLRLLQEDTARQMKLVDGFEKVLKYIEGVFTPYAPCSVLEQVYGKKLENNRDNVVALGKMVVTMSKDKECLKSPVFQQALALFHQKRPCAQSAFQMGNFSLRNGEYDKAIEYLKEAIEMFETNEQKVMPYYLIGLAYQSKNNYSEARNAANSALKIKPNYGRAYILIGDLYSASAGICSGGDVVPYATSWVAADKYSRAAAVDSSVAEEAASRRAKLQYPSITDKHTRGLTDGTDYRVGCWIQETTKVR